MSHGKDVISILTQLDHLNLGRITAERLCTPFSKILGISDDATANEIREKVNEAKDASIDSIVIFDRANSFRNYILIEDVVTNNYQLDKKLLKRCIEVPASSDLFAILNKFSSDCDRHRSHYPLYSVLNPEKRIVGIINFADLNRRPVYIVAYAALVNSEIYLKTEIRKAYGKDDLSWLHILDSKEKGKIDDIKQSHGVDYFGAMSLKHLMSLVKSERCKFKVTDQRELDSLEAISNLRNRVAHPVRILIRRSRYKRDLKDLQRSIRILTLADERYFEKNR